MSDSVRTRTSCYLCIFVIIVSSMIFPTVSQDSQSQDFPDRPILAGRPDDIPKKTTEAKLLDVDDYLAQEIQGDQNADYSVTEIDHQKLQTLPWWVTQITQSKKTTTLSTTQLNPTFKLMPNISRLSPKEKEELLNNPTLLNYTVHQHIIHLYGFPKTEEHGNMLEKVSTALQSDIDDARAVSERDAEISSKAELTPDKLTTFSHVEDYLELLESTSEGLPNLDFDVFTTQETPIETPASIVVRQELQNEPVSIEPGLITETTVATLQPRFLGPDAPHPGDPLPGGPLPGGPMRPPEGHFLPPEEIPDEHITMSPLLVNIKQNMLTLNNGPFKGFLHGLCGIIALKDAEESKQLYEALDRVIGVKSDAKIYDEAMGQDVGSVYKQGAELLNSLDPEAIPTLANTFKELLEVRTLIFDSETNQLLDELDKFYNTQEAEDLLNSILPIYEYPSSNRSADDVAGQLEESVFKPFMNTPPSQLQRKVLIMELIKKELEKRNLLTRRRKCNGPDCADYNYGYKRNNFNAKDDRIRPEFDDQRSRYNGRYSETSRNGNGDYRFKLQTESKPRQRNNQLKNHNLNNQRKLSRVIPVNRYERNMNHEAIDLHKRLKSLQPSKAMQSRYLTPKYDFTYRKAQEMRPKLNLRKNEAVLKDSSYSDYEADLKFNLQDAIRHPHPIVKKYMEHLSGEIKDGRRREHRNKEILDDSSYSDKEGIIKTNIYKALSNKYNNKQ